MLRQTGQIINTNKNIRNFEEGKLYQKDEELLPIGKAVTFSTIAHAAACILAFVLPVILLFLGFNIDLFHKPQEKVRDIEFVLVNQPEQEPINKKTPLRADRNTRAGGIHDPNKKIAPPQPAAQRPSPEQMNKKTPKKVEKQKQAKPQKAITPQQREVPKKIQKQEVAQKPQAKPAPPKPMAKPSIPPTKAPTAMKLPIPPTRGANKISTAPAGPVSSKPTGKYSGSSSSGSPKPVASSSGYGSHSSGSQYAPRGNGAGSKYAPGGGNAGNPGPGNSRGPAGVDAIREPNFGPYMSELSRRIKANWDPPRGEESKRVVLLFTIARDGRLLNVKVIKSSGTAAADRAALAAVELTAPFRPLPAEFRGPNVDIQFTFDYNVFGGRRY